MRKSTLLLSIALLACAALSAWLWQELQEVRTLNRELAARIAPAPFARRAATSATAATPVAVAVSQPAVALNGGMAAPGSQSRTQPQIAAEDDPEYQRRLLRDPRYRETWKQQARITYSPRRENLVRLLGLSVAQADAVMELQIERELQQLDESLSGPLDEAQRQRHQANADYADAELQARLRDLLGPEKYPQLESYMESRQSRMFVDRFRGQLSSADMLRDEQVEPLIAALHVEQSKAQQEMRDFMIGRDRYADPEDLARQYDQWRSERTVESHASMHSAAARLLTAAQLEEFDAMLERERERAETQRQMNQIQSKLGAASAAGGER